MSQQLITALFVSFFTLSAQADAVLPLASGRPQMEGNCWAYGAAHMIESRAQARDGFSAMANLQKSYRYWLIHDRLVSSYQNKKISEGDGGGNGVNDVGAYAADLWDIYAKHGFEMIRVAKAPRTSSLDYPNGASFPNSFQSNPNSSGLVDPNAIHAVERELVSGQFTPDEAEAKIAQALQTAFHLTEPLQTQTAWGTNKSLPVSRTFEKMLGSDFAGNHGVVYLTSGAVSVANRQWLKYDTNRFLAVSLHDKKEILRLLRLSLDRGWPTTFETSDHVMTALGYKTEGSSYSYLLSDSSGAYASLGISWVSEQTALGWFTDATVFYDALADQLPKFPTSKAALPSVRLPRKR